MGEHYNHDSLFDMSDADAFDKHSDKQIAGNHYIKYKIQPFEFSMANNLDPMQHTIIKYVMRHEDKGGEEDLDKAIHVIEMLKEEKYGR